MLQRCHETPGVLKCDVASKISLPDEHAVGAVPPNCASTRVCARVHDCWYLPGLGSELHSGALYVVGTDVREVVDDNA